MDEFNARYGTKGTQLETCDVCHPSFNFNGYGTDFRNNGKSLAAIEQFDSDGDGFTNLQEINSDTFPGDPASVPMQTPPLLRQ